MAWQGASDSRRRTNRWSRDSVLNADLLPGTPHGALSGCAGEVDVTRQWMGTLEEIVTHELADAWISYYGDQLRRPLS